MKGKSAFTEMKFNCLRFLSVVFISIACTCSQSVFAEDTTTDGPAKCSSGGDYNNGACVILDIQYVDETGIVRTCPGELVLNSKYDFIKDTKVESLDIGSCMIRLNLKKSVCGKGTNVVYVFDKDAYESTKNDANPIMQYVRRQEDYHVVEGYQSVLAEEYPSAIIELQRENQTAPWLPKDTEYKKDYCKSCISDTENKYNINGECMFCHSGYYVHAETVEYEGTYYSCEICPAGFACPGNDDEQDEGKRNFRWNNDKAYKGSLLEEDIIECGQDEYAESGSSQCSECAMGYSTYASGPASEVTENNVKKTFDGSCKNRDKGFGIQCIASEACKSIPAQLCYKPKCACDEELANTSGSRKGGKTNFIEERLNCKSSYSLGDNKVWGPVNTKVVQTLRKNNY